MPVDCAYQFALSRSLPEEKAPSVVVGDAAPTALVLACSESIPWIVRARASRSFSIRSYRFRVLQELRDARGEHDNAAVLQDTLSPALKSGNDPMVRNLSQALGMKEVPTLQGLRRNVREKHLILTTVILKLTGKIQFHFPEVILYVGQGLPTDLGVLWLPAQMLESFDSKELVSSHANHKVWRVRIGDTHYAIKEFAIGQPRHLQMCLKEATVIYRHRHPNIVQVKAIFQGSGSE